LKISISDAVRPIVRITAILMDSGGVSARGSAFFSFIFAFLVLFSFAFFDPFRDFDTLSVSAAAFTFLSALLGDVERELRRMHEPRPPSAISRLFLALTEPLVLLGVLYFVYRKPEVLLGPSAITLAFWIPPLFALLLLAAILLSGYIKTMERKVGVVEGFPLEERSGRLYLLSLVLALGIAFGDDVYSGVLLSGAAVLAFDLYAMIYVKLFEGDLPAEVAPEAAYEKRPARPPSLPGIFRGLLGLPFNLLRVLAEREEERKLGPEEVEVPKKKPVPKRGPEDELMTYLFNVMVTDEGGDKMLKGAEVTLDHRDLKKRYSAKTDAAGKAAFEGILEGDYDISVRAGGFEPLTYERPIYGDSGESFALKEISHTFTVEVNDRETFAPIEGAKAILQLQGEEEPVAIVTSDGSGVAKFEEVEERKYLLSIEAQNYGTETVKIEPARKNHITVLLSTRKVTRKKKKEELARAEKKKEEGRVDLIDLISEMEGEDGVLFDDLLEESGMEKGELEKALKRLMEEGEVYEAEKGMYRRI